MFIALYSYRAKPDQMEAIRSLYRQWQRLLEDSHVVSTELLLNSQDPGEMILLARFKDEDAAWAAMESSDYRAWYAQLVHLGLNGPIDQVTRTLPW
jgi:quinol monooxygenase YgiN